MNILNAKHNTLYGYLCELAETEPDKKLVGDTSQWFTASEVLKKTNTIGAQLLDCGVCSGDFIALQAYRDGETLLMLYALRMIGAVVLLTSPLCDPERTLCDCDVAVPFRGIIRRSPMGYFMLQIGKECFTIMPNKETEETLLPTPEPNGDKPGYFIFTSGSTGKSKPVILSDRNLIANLMDSEPLGDYRRDDIALGALPLEHIFGLVLAAGVAILGYSIYFTASTTPASLLSVIRREGITRMNGVPSLYLALAEQCAGNPPETLRAGFLGGAPITVEQFRYIEETLGILLIPVYGMSECIGISCADSHESRAVRCGNVGKIYSMNEVRILNDGGEAVPRGQEGEIVVRGPARMLGYWPNTMPAEEFLHTGDIGYLRKDGRLVISGRKKDIIIRNGKNIAPRHIEDALLSLPEVTAAAVVGIPDEKAGEVPCAMTVGIPDLSALRELLPKNELPVACMCVDALPLTNSGKPDKQKIRKDLIAWRNG